jgi:hypothetical protein
MTSTNGWVVDVAHSVHKVEHDGSSLSNGSDLGITDHITDHRDNHRPDILSTGRADRLLFCVVTITERCRISFSIYGHIFCSSLCIVTDCLYGNHVNRLRGRGNTTRVSTDCYICLYASPTC